MLFDWRRKYETLSNDELKEMYTNAKEAYDRAKGYRLIMNQRGVHQETERRYHALSSLMHSRRLTL